MMTPLDPEAPVKCQIQHLHEIIGHDFLLVTFTVCLQNKSQISLKPAALGLYILCKYDEASCNILSLRASFWFQTIGYGGCFVFQKEAKIFYRNFFNDKHSVQICWRYVHKWMLYKHDGWIHAHTEGIP